MELDTGRHRSGQGRLINCGINRALTVFVALVAFGGQDWMTEGETRKSFSG